jgi:putative copper export protein
MLESVTTTIATAVELLALTVAVGCAASTAWLLPLTDAPPSAELRRRLWRISALCTVVLLGTGVVTLVLRSASMAEVGFPDAFPLVGTVLGQTIFGQLWLWRLAALILLAIGCGMGLRSRELPGASYVALTALSIVAFLLSASGHAGDDGAFSISNAVNTAHIVGAFLWGGGIIASAFIVLPRLARSSPQATALMAHASDRLSTIAAIALLLVLAPGIYHAWLQLGRLSALWESLYGQILLIKITLVGAMMVMGAANRYVFVPGMLRLANRAAALPRLLPESLLSALRGANPIGSFLRSLRIEAALVVAVLVAAAALSQQTPSVHESHDRSAHVHQHSDADSQ